MKTSTATSAGGVVFDGDERVVLLGHTTPNGKQRWSLPKGAVEAGETPEQAAVREVREETGLDAEIVAKAQTIDYWFVWAPDETRYHKYVHYFAMRMTGGDFSRRDDEAERVEWFSVEDALKACSYPNERATIRKALASIRA
ncbi:MAG TPA: NUDIX hydrolase [Actinomycetota bacterium]|nr:NUDIX hydrolase [Actinomycetota bacterium]